MRNQLVSFLNALASEDCL